VAEIVRDFYDRYPYPPPVDSLEKYRLRWRDPRRLCADFHLYWPATPYREDFSLLIAGCGTSQAAKHALRWPSAHVTAIDISATSVRHTEELKRKYELNNLIVHQLAIEHVGQLNVNFDQIICTGVLHHLADPDAGLTALRNVLRPEGAMHVMVYAPYGRSGVYMLQEFCRRTGIHATNDGIRELTAALRQLPRGHPLEVLLRVAPDFREETALADALLHPQDRAYSIPQLFDFIAKAGLTFGRWAKQAPYSARCGVMNRIPQGSRIANLPPVEEYAAAELFRGTMVRHSAIVYRNDQSGTPPIRFTGTEWLAYVPIRMSDTICVHERLPAGAAAVLINQSHTDTDLFLPITAAEKQLFDAIDGKLTMAEICGQSGQSANKQFQRETAGAFFEKLWWHDQIVVDASLSSS
jgi:SAM-dependent methyltransferase